MIKKSQNKFWVMFEAFLGFMIGGKPKKISEGKLHLYQGKKFYFRRNWDVAWKKFLLAESIIPGNAEVQFFLANTYFNLNRLDYALEHIEKFNALENSLFKEQYAEEIKLLSISINSMIGNTKKSIELLKEMAAFDKNEKSKLPQGETKESKKNNTIKYITNKQLGDLYLKDKNYSEAIECYDKALEIEDNSEIYFSKGLLEFTRNDFKKAADEFSKAIEKG